MDNGIKSSLQCDESDRKKLKNLRSHFPGNNFSSISSSSGLNFQRTLVSDSEKKNEIKITFD